MLPKVCISIIGLIFLLVNPISAQQDSSNEVIREETRIKDSLDNAIEEARQRQMQVDLLKSKQQLQESQLKEQQAAQRRQLTIIYLGLSLFILMIAIIIGLIRRNMKLRKFLKEKGHRLDDLEKS